MKVRKRNKLIFGIGVCDADYQVNRCEIVGGKWKTVWKCPFYVKWHGMIERCYSENFKIKHPSYASCISVPEWILFSNFKSWMQTQDWEGKELDKDLLVKDNKVYGPDTCIFVDSKVNNFIVERKAKRGNYPIGVILVKRPKAAPYRANCKSVVTRKIQYLGNYSTPEEAHLAWLAFKLEQAYILAAEQTDERVAKALIDRYENYKGDHLNADLQL